jgi:SAM-dependent methyltransferase
VIDLEPVQDLGRAIRALATTAGWLLIDGTRVVGRHSPDPASVLAHLEGFDLAQLAAGDPRGIASDRLIHRLESIYDLSLADGEADLVSSVSLLEHVDQIEDAMASLRRITKPGGLGDHVVDFIDHRVYGGEVQSPFEFLKIDTPAPIVHGCNRIRCDEMRGLFERFGFDVVQVQPSRTEPVTEAERQQFVEPYRSMRTDNLSLLCARIVVRRR